MAKNKRENGSGSFRKKGDSLEFRVWHDGQPKSFSGKTETECRRKYREWIKKKAQEELMPQPAFSKYNILLIDYLNEWLKVNKYGKVKDSTYDRAESTIKNQIAPYDIAQYKLCELTQEKVQEFINQQSLFCSRSTVQKIYDILNPALSKAYRNKWINEDIMYDVFVPKQEFFINHPTKKIEIYSEEEMAALSGAAYALYDENNRRYRYAPAFVLVLNTGIRFGELLALKWDHVDLDNKRIYIEYSQSYVKNRNRYEVDNKRVSVTTSTKTKNGRRFIPLNHAAVTALEELKNRQASQSIKTEYVISNLQGGQLQGRSVQDVFTDICLENGIVPKGIHALRHTFATKLIQKHVDIGLISKLLGHSSVRITYDTYIHFIEEQKISAIQAVDF